MLIPTAFYSAAKGRFVLMPHVASASVQDLALLVANFHKMTPEGRQAYLLVGSELAAMGDHADAHASNGQRTPARSPEPHSAGSP
jgi:hypothetical protein